MKLPAKLVTVSLLLAHSIFAAEPKDFRIERDVAFLPEDRTEKADLYLPLEIAKGERVPAVVIIHGGGFTGGHRDAARELNIGSTLARNGYIGMSIDYLLADIGKPTWPQNLFDCKTAVRWLLKRFERRCAVWSLPGVVNGKKPRREREMEMSVVSKIVAPRIKIGISHAAL